MYITYSLGKWHDERENNHFQTCINPSVLPVRIQVFDIDTAEIVSWCPDGGVSGPWPPSSEFLVLILLLPPDDGIGPPPAKTSCTTLVPSIKRCL